MRGWRLDRPDKLEEVPTGPLGNFSINKMGLKKLHLYDRFGQCEMLQNIFSHNQIPDFGHPGTHTGHNKC